MQPNANKIWVQKYTSLLMANWYNTIKVNSNI